MLSHQQWLTNSGGRLAIAMMLCLFRILSIVFFCLQSSNVATYIAHGDVALSVLMTTASTLGAIVMTPLLTKTLAGAMIAVDAKVSHFCCRSWSIKAFPQRAFVVSH